MKRIKELRMHLNLSLRQLGSLTKIDYSRLGKLEKNDLNVEEKTLRKLCDFFNVDLSYLLGGDGYIYYFNPRTKLRECYPYNQFFHVLTSDVVTCTIENNKVKRVISEIGYQKLNKYFENQKRYINERIMINKFLDHLSKLNDGEFISETNIITDFIEEERFKRNL